MLLLWKNKLNHIANNEVYERNKLHYYFLQFTLFHDLFTQGITNLRDKNSLKSQTTKKPKSWHTKSKSSKFKTETLHENKVTTPVGDITHDKVIYKTISNNKTTPTRNPTEARLSSAPA